MICACSGGNKQNDTRLYLTNRTDSLWLEFNQVKKLFVYKTDEISDRAHFMDSILQRLKFANPAEISSEELSMITQYTSIQRVYKGFGPKYTECVVETEELFFDVKALDKSVKQGKYDANVKEFKQEYEQLQRKIKEEYKKTEIVTERINTVEPTYQRISPKVEKLTGPE